MARMLRHDHEKSLVMIGVNTHRELRDAFDNSTIRMAALVEGKLIALWGMVGGMASAYGIVWVACSDAIKKFPVALVKEARNQLDDMMLTKRRLFCTLLDGDKAAERFAIFLGFVPHIEGSYGVQPAETRFGRKQVAEHLCDCEKIPLACGGHANLMTYRQMETI
jgi:hypothetical protein